MPLDIQQWYYSKIGKGNCLFLDTWGQTGTHLCNNILLVTCCKYSDYKMNGNGTSMIYIELGGTGILRWDAPERKMRASFPPSKSFALYGVDLVSYVDLVGVTRSTRVDVLLVLHTYVYTVHVACLV